MNDEGKRSGTSGGLPKLRIVLLAAAAIALLMFGRRAASLLPLFATWVEGLGALGPLVFIGGYAAAVVAFVPGSLLTLAGGALFGLVDGVLYVFTAAVLGSTLSFLLAWHVARAAVSRRIEGDARFRAIDRAVGEEGRKIVFLLRPLSGLSLYAAELRPRAHARASRRLSHRVVRHASGHDSLRLCRQARRRRGDGRGNGRGIGADAYMSVCGLGEPGPGGYSPRADDDGAVPMESRRARQSSEAEREEIEVIRIRAGMVTWTLAGTMMISGCSEETAGPSSAQVESSNATPSAAAAPAAEPAAPVADPRTPEELIAAGRVTYNANCIACHGMDPTRDGALGPAVSGSSAELIEARVLRGEYPAGYTPKRETRVMVPLPHLKDKLPELVAYLGSLE